MSAAVCGSKRSHYFFEELPSPPVSKKLRRFSSVTSPARFSPAQPQLLDELKSIFPLADLKVLEKVLEECEDDLELAVKRLNDEVSAGPTELNSGYGEDAGGDVEEDLAGPLAGDEHIAASDNTVAPGNIPANGAEWVELFVNEMMNATSVDDARSRASRVLEILEKSISAHTAEGAAQSFQKEHMMLKEQVEALMRENTILKRAVAIQHERQKEFEDKNRELQQLKQLLSQYQEQLRTLEVNNYALMMHLRQAQQSTPISGHFNPDIF